MPFLKSFLAYIFFLGCFVNPVFAQKKETLLIKKYSPAQLRKDAELFRDVTLAMHPVLGIYQSREFYENRFEALILSLKDSLTEKEFRIKLKLMTDELHCGHTEVLYSKAYYKDVSKAKLNYSPYVFFPVQNKLYVLTNLNKKQDSTLKKGTEITKINGVGVDSMLRYCRRFISSDGYNQTAKKYFIQLAFNSFFPVLFGRPDTFEVEYKEGGGLKKLKYAAFKPKTIPPIPLGAKDDSLFVKYKRAKMKYRFLDDEKKTMLLKIEAFSNVKSAKAYRKLFRKLHRNKSENLIIDLRNNGGGSLENAYRFLTYVIDTPKTQTLRTTIKNYPHKKYTHGNVLFKFTRFVFGVIGKKVSKHDTDDFTYTIKPRKKNHYDKKIIVLINGGSFSASCLVAAYLKDKNRAVFIGEETGGAIEGCNAGVTPYYKLPNTQVKIRIPAFRIIHDMWKNPTGHGILPDYKIEYTFKDYVTRRDLELIKAKDLIQKSTRQN